VTVLRIAGVIAALLATASDAPQLRWGRDRIPAIAACFYENVNYAGRYFCVTPGEQIRTLPTRVSGGIGSMRLVGGAEATVFHETDFRGRSLRALSNIADFRRQGWSGGISSLEVVASYASRDGAYARGNNVGRGSREARWSDEMPIWMDEPLLPREGVCFYEKPDFKGRGFCAPRGATFRDVWKEQESQKKKSKKEKEKPLDAVDATDPIEGIGSVRIIGRGELRVFTERDLHGRGTQIRRDTSDLWNVWPYAFMSFRVF